MSCSRTQHGGGRWYPTDLPFTIFTIARKVIEVRNTARVLFLKNRDIHKQRKNVIGSRALPLSKLSWMTSHRSLPRLQTTKNSGKTRMWVCLLLQFTRVRNIFHALERNDFEITRNLGCDENESYTRKTVWTK